MSNERAAEATNVEKFSQAAAGYGEGVVRSDLEALAAMAGDLRGKKLLDTAAGRGACALRMADQGAEIYLADLTHAMLAQGRADAADGGPEFRAAVARSGSLPFPRATFDVVTCSRAYHHLTDIPGALVEARRVLKPGGRLLVVDHSGPDDPEAMHLVNTVSRLRDESHAETLSPSRWGDALADAGFDLEQMQKVESRQELGALLEAAGDAAPKIEELFDNASASVLQALGFDNSEPAGFATAMVVFNAVSRA